MNRNPTGHPLFSGMAPEKMQFLIQMMGQLQGKSSPDLLAALMSANASAKQQNLSFSDEETNAILELLKPNLSQDDLRRLEMMRSLSRIIAARKGPGGT